MSRRAWLGLVLVGCIYLALAAIYSVVIPLWEAPDEPEHYQYVVHLRRNLALPTAPLPTVQLNANEQSNQAPLAYALIALATWWAGDDAPAPRPNPLLTWADSAARHAYVLPTYDDVFPWSGPAVGAHAARGVSILVGLVAVVAVWLAGRMLAPDRPAVALLGAGLLAVRPGWLGSAATVTNDAAVAAAGAMALVFLLRLWRQPTGRPAWWSLALASVAIGLAVLAKESGLALLPPALAWVAVTGWCAPAAALWGRAGRAAAYAGLLVAGSSALFGWWFARNLLVFGEPIRKELTGIVDPLPVSPFRLLEGVEGYLTSFWGVFGWQQVYQPALAYWLLGAFGLGTVLALGLTWSRRRAERWPLLGLLAMVATVLLAVEYNRQLGGRIGTDHARLWAPAAGAIAVLGGAGLAELGTRLRGAIPWLALGALASWSLVLPFAVIRPSFPDPLPLRSSFLGWRVPGNVTVNWANGLELQAVALPARVRSGTTVHARLYIGVHESPSAPATVFVHIVGRGGLVAQHDAPLGDDVLPVTAWRAGESARVTMPIAVPEDLPAGPYEVRVGLYPPGLPSARLAIARSSVPVDARSAVVGRLLVDP